MESGRIRHRRSYNQPLKVVDVTWVFTEDQFNTFQNFFEDTLGNGVLPFSVYLLQNVLVVGFLNATYSFTSDDRCMTVKTSLYYIEEDELALFGQDFELYELEDFNGVTAGTGLTGNWITADGTL